MKPHVVAFFENDQHGARKRNFETINPSLDLILQTKYIWLVLQSQQLKHVF